MNVDRPRIFSIQIDDCDLQTGTPESCGGVRCQIWRPERETDFEVDPLIMKWDMGHWRFAMVTRLAVQSKNATTSVALRYT
jgi:hypothetical protein